MIAINWALRPSVRDETTALPIVAETTVQDIFKTASAINEEFTRLTHFTKTFFKNAKILDSQDEVLEEYSQYFGQAETAVCGLDGVYFRYRRGVR